MRWQISLPLPLYAGNRISPIAGGESGDFSSYSGTSAITCALTCLPHPRRRGQSHFCYCRRCSRHFQPVQLHFCDYLRFLAPPTPSPTRTIAFLLLQTVFATLLACAVAYLLLLALSRISHALNDANNRISCYCRRCSRHLQPVQLHICDYFRSHMASHALSDATNRISATADGVRDTSSLRSCTFAITCTLTHLPRPLRRE